LGEPGREAASGILGERVRVMWGFGLSGGDVQDKDQ